MHLASVLTVHFDFNFWSQPERSLFVSERPYRFVLCTVLEM